MSSNEGLSRFGRLSFLIAVTFFAANFSFSQAENRLVETLEVQGNYSLKDSEILSLIKTSVGETYDPNLVKQDLERLLATGKFNPFETRANIEDGLRGGVVVIFEVKEFPLVKSFVVRDFKLIRSKRILAYLKQEKLLVSKGDLFDHRKGREISEAISEFLKREGFQDVIVNFSVNEAEPSSVDILVEITENEPD